MTHFAPLQRNPRTGELFLPLKRHPNIVLTPPRMTDAESLPPLFNDPRVYEWLERPPYPYTLEDAESWLTICTQASQETVAELDAAQKEGKSEPILVDGCPTSSLREVQEDGTDTFIGSVMLDRWRFHVAAGLNAETRAQLVKANLERAAGDPGIIWTIGDYLAPSHHGRGIMTDALETLLYEWAIPRMGLRHVTVAAFTGNHGSVRVFEKLGFGMRETLDDFAEVKGKMRGYHVLERKFSEVS